MSNAYNLLVDAAKATFNATGRSWDNLSDGEKGERINAQRQGFKVILAHYEDMGYGMRTECMRQLVEATETPDAEETIAGIRTVLQNIINGESFPMTTEAAQRLLAGLDAVELAD